VADPDSLRQTRLTHNDVRDDQPVWSPTGSRIAFVSYLDEDPEIFVMNAEGGDQTRLTNNDFSDVSPTW
jgi:TolB protein